MKMQKTNKVKIVSSSPVQTATKFTIALLFVLAEFKGQNREIQTKLSNGEFQMTFPSIYFKHNSADYAPMPYSVDSCFKYIATHVKDIPDFVIWRDSLETEKLTRLRIKKLKTEFNKFKQARNIYIESMGKKQKISRYTIEKSVDKAQTQYLLSLNSVFDISKTRITEENKKASHYLRPKIWCWSCWINLFHLNKKGRRMRQNEKMKLKLQKQGGTNK